MLRSVVARGTDRSMLYPAHDEQATVVVVPLLWGNVASYNVNASYNVHCCYNVNIGTQIVLNGTS